MTTVALPRQPHSAWLARLRTIGIFIGARGAVGVGLARQRGGAAAGLDWTQWFDHCWVAKGAASLAASYADLVGSQTLTTTAAPTLGADGWNFDGTQYLDTGILVPSSIAGLWSFVCQYQDFGTGPVGYETLFGGYNILVRPYWFGIGVTRANGGAATSQSPSLLTGNYALSGLTSYRNGVDDGALSGGSQRENDTMHIGCNISNGSRGRYGTVKIQAFGIKHAILTAGQVAAAYAAMAAL